MRKFFSILIFVSALAEGMEPAKNFLEARGFTPAGCYQNIGDLTCDQASCELTAFTGPRRLSFKTQLKDLKRILPSHLLRLFTFKVLTTRPTANVEILSFDDLPESLGYFDQVGLAKKIDCP